MPRATCDACNEAESCMRCDCGARLCSDCATYAHECPSTEPTLFGDPSHAK